MIYELRKVASSEVTKTLQEFCKHYVYPKKIVTDNGTQFTSAMWTEFMIINGMKHILTTYYHPQSNPFVRYNKMVGRISRTFCSNDHRAFNLYMYIRCSKILNKTVSAIN